ncbi:MAG: biotin/lipoyl-binding protein [Bacteroidales bacterium]|nr:biotin/lipoyl-binding protein [Bacteroidales bacterium]
MKNYKFTINGNKYSVDVADIEDNKTSVEVNGTAYEVELDMEVPAARPKPVVKPVAKAAAPQVAAAPTAKPAAAPTSGTAVKSPLPGRVLDVFVKVGDAVKQGQHLVLLEAMKMENNIDSDIEGTVTEVRARRDDSVMEGDVLVIIG